MITVVVFGMFRDHLPEGAQGNRTQVPFEEGMTVAGVAERMGIPTRAVFAALIDGESAKTDRPVPDGAEVTLMPPFTGGSQLSMGSE